MATKYADMAEAEAQRAEAENPDLPDGTDTENAEEGEAAPDDEGAADEGEADEQEQNEYPPGELSAASLADWEKEADRHGKALLRLLERHGPFFSACPQCAGAGAIFGEADPLGHLVMSPNEAECPDCNGMGYLRHPSRHEDITIRRTSCLRCAGQGWIAVQPPAPPAYVPPTTPAPVLTGYIDPNTGQFMQVVPPIITSAGY